MGYMCVCGGGVLGVMPRGGGYEQGGIIYYVFRIIQITESF